jgi:hypothetical protein
MPRKSLAEVEVRRMDVYQMMMEGKNINQIVAYCNLTYGVKRSAVEKDMMAVKQDLIKEFQSQKEDIIAVHTQRYENLYRFYMDKGTDEEPNIHWNPEKASYMLEKKERLLRLHNPQVQINQQNIDKQVNISIDWSQYSKEEILKLAGDDSSNVL